MPRAEDGASPAGGSAERLRLALLQVTAGDRDAFAELYQATAPKLFGVCLRILSDHAEAEEALQEAYLSIWRRAGTFDPDRGAAIAWLVTLARNCAVDRLRARRNVAAAPLDLADDIIDQAPLAPDRIERAQEARSIADCIDALKAGEAGLIRAAFYEGSTYAELATRSASPLGTVKSRIRRALLKLAECLR